MKRDEVIQAAKDQLADAQSAAIGMAFDEGQKSMGGTAPGPVDGAGPTADTTPFNQADVDAKVEQRTSELMEKIHQFELSEVQENEFRAHLRTIFGDLLNQVGQGSQAREVHPSTGGAAEPSKPVAAKDGDAPVIDDGKATDAPVIDAGAKDDAPVADAPKENEAAKDPGLSL